MSGEVVDPGPDEATRRAKARRRNIALLGGAALAAAAFGVYTATQHKPAEATTAEDTSREQVVTVARAEVRPFSRRVPLSGEARPRKDVRVFAPSSGVRILELMVEQGDTVKRGQPLARLDTTLVQAQGQSALAGVKEAEAAQSRAEDAYKRALSIKDSGALSAEAIDQRRAEAGAAAARLSAAQAQYNEWQARMQGGYVRAPVGGLVIERPAQLGSLVDGQSLFRIAGDNQLEVAGEVAESDMLALKVGQKATFRLVDGSPIIATLRRPPPAIDSRTRTGQALFDLPADPKLRSGMFLRGDAELAPQDALAIPQAAVMYDGPNTFVFVVDANNRARRTIVELGDRDGELVVVKSGLSVGSRVAAGGAAFLQDGDPVRPVEPGQKAEPETAEAVRSMGG